MTRTSARHLLAVAALIALAVAPTARAFDDSDLPETLRKSYVSPVVGPANDESYAHGELGLVRTSYGRASLYVAWRAMQLPPGKLANESHRREGTWVSAHVEPRAASAPDEIHEWLAARSAWIADEPAVRPDYFRTVTMKVPGFAGRPDLEVKTTSPNCGPDAFVFAARTLRELSADTTVSADDRRTWIAGQDAVFARCSWKPGSGDAPPLPASLDANATPRLKALRAYQHATALFYSGDFEHALPEFDAMARTPGHPMQAWSALAAMRCVVRKMADDPAWQAAFDDAYVRRKMRGAALTAALAEPAAKRRAQRDAALADLGVRMRAIDADPACAPVKAAGHYTLRRAYDQFAPVSPMLALMKLLDQVERNPYTLDTLASWNDLYARSLPDRPEGTYLPRVREHAFFDWILTVQGCGDAGHAPDPAICDQEHAHAAARWQETRRNDWLLATLMTARQPSSADLSAAEAARAVPRERPEWASLQLYAARVLRAQGKADDAREVLGQLSGTQAFSKADRSLLDGERRALSM
jgi:hypothetical protein